MELLLLLMMIHSHIHFSLCLPSQIMRSMCQILHTLCIHLSLMVRNPMTFRIFPQPYKVLLVSLHLPYLISCDFTSPPMFLTSIQRASLNIFNISFLPPFILVENRNLYQCIPMSILICLYVIFWIFQKLYQPMDPMHLHSLILFLLYVPT